MGLIYTSLQNSPTNVAQVHSSELPGEIHKGNEMFLSLCT